jgi:serine protease Do
MRELAGEFEGRGQREAAGNIEGSLQGNAATGFVYVAADGANYVITAYRVISLASGLSIQFEGASYTGLSIVAADEELDIALLAFENGARPFAGGLSLLQRRLRDEETVYSAGFPGGEAAWQFSEGLASGTYVRIPANDETMRPQGPYIRHSARTDRENPGGLLLAADPGAPAGYAVAGIMPGAGGGPAYAVPIDRVEDFLQRAQRGKSGDERSALEERLLAFSRFAGLRSPYRYIAAYLSAAYIAENTANVIPALDRAFGAAIADIARAFNRSPAEGIRLAAAWSLEDYLRGGNAASGIEAETIEKLGTGLYHTGFRGVPGGALWINEYGVWRIRSFDAPLAGKAAAEGAEPEDTLRTAYLFSFSIGYAQVFNEGHALTAEYSFHQWFLTFGPRIFYAGPSYLRGEYLVGLHFPIRVKNRLGLIPFTGAGAGFVRRDSHQANSKPSFDLCVSGQAGLRITSSLVPGLFLQGMYQYNYEIFGAAKPNPHSVTVSIGYGF